MRVKNEQLFKFLENNNFEKIDCCFNCTFSENVDVLEGTLGCRQQMGLMPIDFVCSRHVLKRDVKNEAN